MFGGTGHSYFLCWCCAPDENSVLIANHIIEFLQSEVKNGRLPKNLLPLQSGVGSIANAVVVGILNSPFENLTVWTEVFQDNLLDMTHVDHTEHDMDVLVAEQGLADLRGLCPRECAQRIITRCAHPEYRPILQDYFDRSLRECLASDAAHEPHMLYKVFNMHKILEENGTMKLEHWD